MRTLRYAECTHFDLFCVGKKSVKLADTPDSVHAGYPTRDRH